MDDAGYGIPNRLLPSISKPQILHLTRKHSYVGPAWYIREISVPSDWEGKNIELKLERVIWQTNVWIDGKEVDGEQESLISPHYFDLTEYLSPGKHRIAIRVDNRKNTTSLPVIWHMHIPMKHKSCGMVFWEKSLCGRKMLSL